MIKCIIFDFTNFTNILNYLIGHNDIKQEYVSEEKENEENQ